MSRAVFLRGQKSATNSTVCRSKYIELVVYNGRSEDQTNVSTFADFDSMMDLKLAIKINLLESIVGRLTEVSVGETVFLHEIGGATSVGLAYLIVIFSILAFLDFEAVVVQLCGG